MPLPATLSLGATCQAQQPPAPGPGVVNEGESAGTAQQFRHYRSYGRLPDASDPRTSRPRTNGTRALGPDYQIGPQRPQTTAPSAATQKPAPAPLDKGKLACANRYPTFNARTGNYITPDGEVQRCPYLS